MAAWDPSAPGAASWPYRALPPPPLQLEAKALLADKAYDADERMIAPLEAAGKTAVIPPRKNRANPRTYDKAL